MLSLIDSDSICYAAAHLAEHHKELLDPSSGSTEAYTVDLGPQAAEAKLDSMIESLLIDLNTEEYILFCTGPTNFRYAIFPEYKSARSKAPKPKYLQICKDRLRNHWKAVESVNCEADDLIGIEAMRDPNREVCIVSIDKDLNTIPGLHINPKTKARYYVSPRDALRFFYFQLLAGDSADGIKGAAGIGHVKANRILDSAYEEWIAEAGTEEELAVYYFEAVQGYFSCHEELMLNARCLYIWQRENDEWRPPVEIAEGMDTSP
jgi:5'-3' exonuclease